MNFYFHADAEREFDKAVEYYESCRSGLGLEFSFEVYAAIHRILKYPEAWTPLSENTRRCLVKRFPFGVVYQMKSDRAYIIAVADLRRRPDYWLKRL